MSDRYKWVILILVVLALATALRTVRLGIKPLHGDEAVQAYKFGELVEKGEYRYDSNEYHGPTLYYFTLIPAYLAGIESYANLDEWVILSTPIGFGLLLILLHLLLVKGVGRGGVILGSLLVAISPAFVYYGRYYIQESLLVCFTFGAIACGYRYLQQPRSGWAIGAGLCLGLMHATKETCIIAWFSMGTTMLFVWALDRRRREAVPNKSTRIRKMHLLAGLIAGTTVSCLFYSSFCTYPEGIVASAASWKTYFSRAVDSGWHIHPWYTYFKILFFTHDGPGPIWSEAFILLLAVFGGVFVWRGTCPARMSLGLLRFLSIYTAMMAIIYSMIPYKTPWCLLSFWHGAILLAAVGGVGLYQACVSSRSRIIISMLLAGGLSHLFWLSLQTNFVYCADPRNPYAYGHTSTDVLQVTGRIQEISRMHQDKENMRLDIICPRGDSWPLPWYLRSLDNGNIGWYSEIPADYQPAPVIIISPDLLPELQALLLAGPQAEGKRLYVDLFNQRYYLRPNVELRGLVSLEFWNSLK
jgi:uncharacterized protein (TIGR03663 family)